MIDALLDDELEFREQLEHLTERRWSQGPRRTFVYWLLTSDGRRYVGSTKDVRHRLYESQKAHALTQPWWPSVERVTVEVYESEALAREAEAWHIAEVGLAALLNKQHEPRRSLTRPLPVDVYEYHESELRP